MRSAATVDHVTDCSAPTSTASHIGVDCANGAYSGLAPKAFAHLGAQVTAIGDAPDGDEHQRRVRRDRPGVPCNRLVTSKALDFGVAFDGDGDRMLAVDERGEVVDGDQILAILALGLERRPRGRHGMANLGLHRLMEEHGIRVVTTDVGDRYVLEALRREGGLLGGEQSATSSTSTATSRATARRGAPACRALEGRKLSRRPR